MINSGFSIKVPGKLMIAGEYAVLEPNQRAMVVAVNRYITAHIEPSRESSLYLPQWGLEDITWELGDEGIRFSVSDSRLNFIQNSISVAKQFLQEKSVTFRPFHLKVTSELDDPLSGKKYGLGSSAAVVVAVISAILHFHGEHRDGPNLNEIFKLSAIAHVKTQGSGSGADIGAAVYGGWLEYSAFRTEWILKELDEGKKLKELMDKPWPNLLIKPIIPPSNLQLVVGWTKEPASTAPMIKSFEKFKDENLESYNEFIRESTISVDRLIGSFEENDCLEAIKSLSENRKILQKLGENANIPIETVKLKNLCSIAERFGSGKSSGAGGGDCGIAFLKGNTQISDLYKAWNDSDIIPLNLSVSKTGVSIKLEPTEPTGRLRTDLKENKIKL